MPPVKISTPVMPLATAVWLFDNTSLTFKQIANFCGLHESEVQAIADGEMANNIIAQNPITLGQLTDEEIKKCEKNRNLDLALAKELNIFRDKKTKKYIPTAQRQNKPDAISWIIKYYPEVEDSKIIKLIGTTKKTIESIRGKTHANILNIKPRDPVLLGICTQTELDNLLAVYKEKRSKAN